MTLTHALSRSRHDQAASTKAPALPKNMHLCIVCDPPVGARDQNTGGTHAVIAHYRDEMLALGHQVTVVDARFFGEVPSREHPYDSLAKKLDSIDFDAIHLVTQSRLAFLARRYCVARGLNFTTAFHTQYPEWLSVRHGVPERLGYAYISHFCNAAETTIVPTPSMADKLTRNGVRNAIPLSHGVDVSRFRPGTVADRAFLDHLPRPIWLYVGRIMVEKGPEDICRLKLPGTVVMVGGVEGKCDTLEVLRKRYPHVVFPGVKSGSELTAYYKAADRFIFASQTDTFGLVLLEALASGLPVAAYPVTGPKDVLTDPRVGCMCDDLQTAALATLELDPRHCRNFAEQYTWTNAATRFAELQVPAGEPRQRGKIGRFVERRLNVQSALVERAVMKAEHALFGR